MTPTDIVKNYGDSYLALERFEAAKKEYEKARKELDENIAKAKEILKELSK